LTALTPPPGTVWPGKPPAAIVQKTSRDVNSALAMPDVHEKMDTHCAEDGGDAPEKFAQFIRSDQDIWTKVVNEAKVKLET
jgi:tripartite-type tricarboxylate transporter receptor subunit TctC